MPMPECTRISIDDAAGRERLLADGWREIEVLQTWYGSRPGALAVNTRLKVTYAGPYEHHYLRELAARSFRHDRLHADPTVAKADADDAKRMWVTNAMADDARKVAFAQYGSEVTGLLIWKRTRTARDINTMVVDLLAVDERYRRHDIATTLIAFGFDETGARRIQAGTQSTNAAAIAFYKSLGMKLKSEQRTFHRP